MNNKPNYAKGKRKEITELILECGCVPVRNLSLIAKDESELGLIRQQLYNMLKEDSIRKTGNGLSKAITLNYLSEKKYLTTYDPNLLSYYENTSSKIAQDAQRRDNDKHDKAIRNAETHIFMRGAGVVTNPTEKESLANSVRVERPTFYTNRESKGEYKAEKDNDGNLTGKTRVNGLLYTTNGIYAVYDLANTYTEVDAGEYSIKYHYGRMLSSKMTAIWEQEKATYEQKEKDKNLLSVKAALLLYQTEKVLSEYVQPKMRRHNHSNEALYNVYNKVYALPLDKNGQKMLQMMHTVPEYEKTILAYLQFLQCTEETEIECDAMEEDSFNLVFLIPDVRKLRIFINQIKAYKRKNKCRIYCYDFQEKFISDLIQEEDELGIIRNLCDFYVAPFEKIYADFISGEMVKKANKFLQSI